MSEKSKKSGKLNPNRFKQEPQSDDLGMFSFDPIRTKLFLWGVTSGVAGGILSINGSFVWQMIIVVVVTLTCNYQIAVASQKIPRPHAITMALLGLAVAMLIIGVINTTILPLIGQAA